ncbi:hypothetical protein SAMN05216326_10314 [Nitrosomonas marina]|uniref:Uncharacterized protein n=1 Tax=Nitrosomonas marina TaxID=917 RepID=A0A1H9YYU3_9PROT|nr:hypothetical protein [Nitrosomonas marina]SES74432.1 hypothetical protein SAMN05216326_10314 [Nitrosomonas marina]
MHHTILREQDVSLLRAEIEMLMVERQSLLKTVGAAAKFIACLDSRKLPEEACETAERLAKSLNQLSEDTLQDALEKIKA